MALDSRDKRASANMVSLPFRGMWPVPNSGVDAEDRQQVAFMTQTPSADAPPVETEGGNYSILIKRRRRNLLWPTRNNPRREKMK